MHKTLIQLIGKQTLPNIFPILAIKPQRVVNIYTADTEKQHQKIVDWFSKYGKKYGIDADFVEYPAIRTKMSECHADINSILLKEKEESLATPDALLILNMTGGTKSMSANALINCIRISGSLKAAGKHSIAILYLNPSNGEIEIAAGEEYKQDMIACPANEIKIALREIIEAGGDTIVVKAREDWQAAYPLACKLRDLAKKRVYLKLKDITRSNYRTVARESICSMLVDSNADKLKTACIELKKLAALAAGEASLRSSIEACGFTVREDDFYLHDSVQKKIEALSQQLESSPALSKDEKNNLERKARFLLSSTINFFVGGWWEVIVAHAYQTMNPDAEVLWSVETATHNDLNHAVETDIIASDGRSLCCISCKRGLHEKVTQELEQHCTRTALLGGVISKRIIAVFNDKTAHELKPLVKALDLTLWDNMTVSALKKQKKPGIRGYAEESPAPSQHSNGNNHNEIPPRNANTRETLSPESHSNLQVAPIPTPQPAAEVQAEPTPARSSFFARLTKGVRHIFARQKPDY